MKSPSRNWLTKKEISPAPPEKALAEMLEAQNALIAPRLLMASVRSVMMGSLPASQKIDEIVKLVAQAVRAEVCSCFVQRAGDLLELFSTVGLSSTLAHKARVRVGEGLVGEIAAHSIPFAVSNVTAHPAFVSRPETGGMDFRSFCGVPVLRGGAVRGVLVVQNRLQRNYGVEVVEILQTVSVMLAELIASQDIVTIQEISSESSSGKNPTRNQGVSLGRGLAMGQVVLYEPRLTIQNMMADDPNEQKIRLRQAVAGMHEAIHRMLDQEANLAGSETRDILEAYQMFARDKGWLSRLETSIDKGLSSEAAVQSVLNETRARMMQLSDGYIRETLQDMEDLSNRLLSHLMKTNLSLQQEQLPEDIILVARSMGPAALLDYDSGRLKGVVLEKGSQSNHVAIVARSLGIPVIGQCGDVLNYVRAGDQVIVDGDHGVVYIRPSAHIIELYTRSMDVRTKRTSAYKRIQHQPSITKDGVKISVNMNAGLLSEMAAFQDMGADGIGLFRTELSFMSWKKFPPVVKQAELYSKIYDQMGGKPVIFRTLDIGGDKPLPYFESPEEANPALGWRAVRIGIDRPAVLRTQFRALIQGAKGRPLKIMLPLVTEVAELDRARELLEMEKTRARHSNTPLPEKIEMGVMLEVPALLWQMDEVLKTVDFVSVGTNDLMQYLYAADRSNNAIRGRYDQLSPAMLRVLKMIVTKCQAAGVPVSVCGEMAGQPLEAMVLIALGYETLSLSGQSIEAVKMMIPTIDTGRLLPYLETLMNSREHSLRERLLSFARDHRVHLS